MICESESLNHGDYDAVIFQDLIRDKKESESGTNEKDDKSPESKELDKICCDRHRQ